MIDIGIDFGSTYTTVSIYNKNTHILNSLNLDGGFSPYVPSMVAKRGNEIYYGSFAKQNTGKRGVTPFKAFKMLLPEKNQDTLKERGYDNQYTPVQVTTIFIEKLLKQVLMDTGETTIGKLVIGAPEIWSDGIGTLGGRTILRDICKSFDFVDKVQVVSEPAAASAFFSYNYLMNTGNNFEGNILLVDYGGGTLDITLTNVETVTESDGRKMMEIKVIERTGAGENEDGEVGKAGIIYMEKLMQEAICRAEIFDKDEEIPKDGKFYKAVDELEKSLKTGTQEVENTFETQDIDDIDELNDIEFTTIEYKGEDVEISYGMLVEVYNREIRGILEENLDKICKYLDESGFNYSDGNDENFKIALVGGFGNFYLVKAQLRDYFELNTYDRRQQDIIVRVEDCEKAISLGTALLASNVIGIKNTAAYSIGIWSTNMHDNSVLLNYAIRYKQDIEFGREYFQCASNGQPRIIFTAKGGFDKFIINFGSDDKTNLTLKPKEQFAQRLQNVVTGQYHMAVVGFAIDSSGVVTLHAHNYDMFSGKIEKEPNSIELAQFSDLFEVTTFN